MKQKFLLLLLILFLPVAAFAHSGGTDAKGGHYNHSTGEYHYHHGYSAHQHPNGVCPYEKKETVTKGTTYSYNFVATTSTPRPLIVITARPVVSNIPVVRASNTATPRPAATSNIRPAVTVAPAGLTTATPTARITSTPNNTSIPRNTSTAHTTVSTSAGSSFIDDLLSDFRILILFGIFIFTIWHSIKSSYSQKRERENYYRELRILKLELQKKDKLLQSSSDKIASLEQKLRETPVAIETPPPVAPSLPDVAPVEIPSLPDLSIRSKYILYYPQTWMYIKQHAKVPNSYVSIYNYHWGKLQEFHGDGIIFDTLSEEEQALVHYQEIGKHVYLSSLDTDTYHSTPNCYSLLKSNPVEVDALLRTVYQRCSKCVPPPK